MSVKRWAEARGDKELSRAIAQKFRISPFAAHLLVTRGIISDEAVSAALTPLEQPLSNPFLLKGMGKAVQRIIKALDNGETIAVYGDYDVDGVTATALVYAYLESVGAHVMYMLPSRDDGGYGLHLHSIDAMKDAGVSLIITVDNGVSALEEIAYASTLGIDVVVTDHHRPPQELPAACAVVDAHAQSDDIYKNFAGVGVAFKLACALEMTFREYVGRDSSENEEMPEQPHTPPQVANDLCRRYADLVALGTVADAVPLDGENRVLTAVGLEMLKKAERVGVRLLMEVSGVDIGHMTATDISFVLAPRLNSAGRLGKPDRAVRLMISEDIEECRALACELQEENIRRHDCEREISMQAWKQLEERSELADDPVVLVSGEGWNSGVIGIFAARLCERLGKPCFVLAIDGDTARGSGRGPEGFSLHEVLTACSDLLVMYGGHSQAVGFTIETDKIEQFRKKVNEFSRGKDIPVPVINVDCALPIRMVTVELAEGAAAIEPFGSGNPTPLVAVRGVQLRSVVPVGGGNHQRLLLGDENTSVTAMYFSMRTDSFRYRAGDRVDCVLSVGVKYYRGVKKADIIVRDMRLSAVDEDITIADERLCERFRRGERLSAQEAAYMLPTREDMAAVYRYIKHDAGCDTPETIAARIGGISPARVEIAEEILKERGLIKIRLLGGRRWLSACMYEGKVSMEDSPIMTELRRAAERELCTAEV